jgi:uncharacterized protein (TIGR02147 family)
VEAVKEQTKLAKPHQLLNKAYLLKKKRNPSYSQRAVARDLCVSPMFVTKLFTGKSAIPTQRLKQICAVLDMDTTAQTVFYRSLIVHSLPSPELRKIALSTSTAETRLENYEQMPQKKFGVLSQWYHLAILNLLTCDIDHSSATLARKLGITETEVENSLQLLKTLELASFNDGVWKKTDLHMISPTTRSKAEVRNFHRSMIKKAYDELSRIGQEAFNERLITGFTIAVNPENLEEAKRLIFDTLSDLSHKLSQGSCTEVYQCNVQLFPLTKKERRS